MNFVVFDTETTSLNKPFCYNTGYIITNEKGEIFVERDFIIEQVWHNLPLFSTTYYAEKRPLYVRAMKARKTIMDKFGHVCQKMIRDFKAFDVTCAYAYNSSFDEKVFNFNCDWFKCINPFDNLPIYDIRGNVHAFIVGDVYKEFCEEHNLYTESGCYSSTAENVYRFITGRIDWEEDHTALSDSKIEAEILLASLDCGAELGIEYPTRSSLGTPNVKKVLHIKQDNSDFYFEYEKIRINKEKTEIKLN